jgi:ribonuclease-3
MANQKIINLLKKYNIDTSNTELFDIAFTHVSYRNAHNLGYDYEKLEFLGDAIINKIVSEYLYVTKKNSLVGELSKTRALITQGKTEAIAAKIIGLEEIINFTGDKTKIVDSVMEDVYEAFIGAIYLACGEEKAKEIINSTLIDIFNKNRNEITDDYKTKLQELVYKVFKTFPVYKTVKQPDNEYIAKLYIKKKLYSKGSDKKIKDAEQKAAKECYKKLSV